LSYLIEVSEKAFRLLVPRYGMVFEEIQPRLDQDLEEYKDDDEREREEKKHHLYQLKQQLEQYLQELPVVGFNTGKYDVNAMKVDFFTRLVYSHKIKYNVKRNNNFMCIKTEKLKFLDIATYLAPGFSYCQYRTEGVLPVRVDDVHGQTERQPAATSRSLFQYLEE
jgi:hypothetical protein